MTFMKGLPLLLVASLCSHAALQPDRTLILCLTLMIKLPVCGWIIVAINSPPRLFSLENEKGRKAMIFWCPAADTTSGTESNNAGTDSKSSANTKLPGDRETLFFLQYA